MKENATILVTGGAGFIGANFILYWMKQYPNHSVINLDALTYAGNTESLASVAGNPNYQFIHGDIRDADTVDAAMKGVDMVIHFAAESHVDRSIKEPALFLKTNILGTHQLLQAAVKHQIAHFHHISTDEVFGSLSLETTEKFSESTPYDPRSPYAASKAGSDHIVRAFAETYGLHTSITNCSNNYGALQFPEKMIPLAITNLIDDTPVPIYGDGQYIRDWLYVTDHCRAIDAVVQQAEPNSTYLVGGLVKGVSNLQLVKILLELMNKPSDMLSFIQDRPGHDRKYSVDWSKIKSDLEWQPTVSLKEGLAQTVEWYQTNQDWWRPLKEKNQAYFEEQYKGKDT